MSAEPADLEREYQFDLAELEAKHLVEATIAVEGYERWKGTPIDVLTVLLRLAGPGVAGTCDHVTEPQVVLLHPAARVHLCRDCSLSDETMRAWSEHRASTCDSCGETAESYSRCRFAVSNIVATAFLCDECRFGRRHAALPPWAADY